MISALLSRPRRLVATLALLLASVGVAVGSGATFTSQTANASNVFTAGTLTQTNSAGNGAILTATNMKPTDVQTGTVTIKNTGSISGVFKLTETGTNGFAAGKLALKVEDVTNAASPVTVYTGDVGGLASKTLGTFAAGESHTYKFTVTLDGTADNTQQGKTATETYTWDATQA